MRIPIQADLRQISHWSFQFVNISQIPEMHLFIVRYYVSSLECKNYDNDTVFMIPDASLHLISKIIVNSSGMIFFVINGSSV